MPTCCLKKCLLTTVLCCLGAAILARQNGLSVDGPSAVVERIPNKQIVMFLDNSQTIVNTRPDRLSLKLNKMLMDLLDSNQGFLNPDDQLSIYNFDNGIDDSSSRIGIDGADSSNWGEALEYFSAQRDGGTFTQLTSVLERIAQQVQQPAPNGELRIFIVASDFVHDPGNAVSTQSDNYIGEVQSQIAAMGPDVIDAFSGPNPTSFLILLSVRPDSLGNSRDSYRKAFYEINRAVIANLETNLKAQTLYYGSSGSSSGSDLARFIVSKTARWVQIVADETIYLPSGAGFPDVQLTLYNPHYQSVQVTGFSITPEANMPAQKHEISPFDIPRNSRATVLLQARELPPGMNQENLFLRPLQSPEPASRPVWVELKNIPRADAALVKAEPKLLYAYGFKNQLLIRGELALNRDNPTRGNWVFWLEEGGDPTKRIRLSRVSNQSAGMAGFGLESFVEMATLERHNWSDLSLIAQLLKNERPVLELSRNLAVDARPAFLDRPNLTILLWCLLLLGLRCLIGRPSQSMVWNPQFTGYTPTLIAVFLLLAATLLGLKSWLFLKWVLLLAGLMPTFSCLLGLLTLDYYSAISKRDKYISYYEFRSGYAWTRLQIATVLTLGVAALLWFVVL